MWRAGAHRATTYVLRFPVVGASFTMYTGGPLVEAFHVAAAVEVADVASSGCSTGMAGTSAITTAKANSVANTMGTSWTSWPPSARACTTTGRRSAHRRGYWLLPNLPTSNFRNTFKVVVPGDGRQP
ncbi:Os03g0723901 [Oryza sativa Japonica Group]|uniref:Os03g0723901 protein n=1 Tax=Oryza sativa subsp. japonica TaxID=39947 RepID=A0A0P0W2U1_ORYSJ|nr:Os03g0723901 [Oryza sativa Japonica Group]